MNLAIVVATTTEVLLQLWTSGNATDRRVSDDLAKYNGVYYRIAYKAGIPTAYRVIKSTDDGATWVYADAIAKYTGGYSRGFFFHDHYIYYYFSDSVTWGSDAGHMYRWDVETETWDGGFDLLLPYSGAFPGSPDMGDPEHRLFIRARSDGTFVAVYKHLNWGEVVGGKSWARVMYRTYSGGAWGAESFVMGGGEQLHVNLGSVAVGTDDRVHAVLVTEEADDNKPFVTKIWAVTVEANNTIGSPTLVTNTPDTTVNPTDAELFEPWFIGRGQASSTVVAFSMRVLDSAVPKLAMLIGTPDGSSWSLEMVSTNVPPVWDSSYEHWMMPVLVNGSVVYAIWPGPEFSDNWYLYGRKRSAAGVWGAETVLIDGHADPVLDSPRYLQDVSVQLVDDGTMAVSGWASKLADAWYGAAWQAYFGILADVVAGCRYHGF